MFLSVILTGCEDDGDDGGLNIDDFWGDIDDLPSTDRNVTVVLEAKANTMYTNLHPGLPPSTGRLIGVQVVIAFKINGWTEETQTVASQNDGWTKTASAILVVYENQRVGMGATLAYMDPLVRWVGSGEKTFSWNDIWVAAGEEWGGTCYFSTEFTLMQMPK